MPTNSLPDLLSSYGACSEACDWAEGRLVDEAAYLECPRGDWLLWLLAQLGLPRPQLVLAACACARTALRYVPEGEERPRIAIEVAEAWARGGEGAPTLAELWASAGDAIVAAGDAIAGTMVASPAAYAAYAAAHAAFAAYADAAAYAAYAADDDCVNYVKALAECADIVRSIITWEDVAALAARAP